MPSKPKADAGTGEAMAVTVSRFQEIIDAQARRDESGEVTKSAEREYLCVVIQGARYAIPIDSVAEVVKPGPVTEVPYTPPYIRGVFNRHGHVTAVLDLGMYRHDTETKAPKRLVVIQAGELEAAVPVTEILGVATVAVVDVEPPLPQVAEECAFVSGQFDFGGKILSIIDGQALLDGGRLKKGAGLGE